MRTITKIRLNLSQEPQGVLAAAKQGDRGSRLLTAEIVSGELPAMFEEGITAYFYCERPDGHLIAVPAELTGSLVQAPLTEECLSRPGNCRCEFVFRKKDRLLSTPVFELRVCPGITGRRLLEERPSPIDAVRRAQLASQANRAAAGTSKPARTIGPAGGGADDPADSPAAPPWTGGVSAKECGKSGGLPPAGTAVR